MEEKFVFTEEEKHACEALTKEIHEMLNDTLSGTDVERLRTHIHSEIEARHIERDRFGLNPVLKALMTAKVAVGDIGLRRCQQNAEMVVFIDMQHAGLNDAVAALGKHVAEKGEQIG